MQKKLIIAKSFKIIKGRIQLFDENNKKINGKGAKWEGWFNCSNNPGLTSLEGAPETVGGWFNCSNNPGLTSLEGAPETVGGGFDCSNNPGLTSLEGAPETVGGGFDCYNNPGLTSLEGAPETVGGWFDCSNNPGLTSLEGAPETVGVGFDCYNNPGLTSLEGAPETVGRWFNCSNNPGLTSLEGAPETVGDGFDCSNNPGLTSLEGAPETVGGWFNCSNNPGLTSLEGAPETVGRWFDCYNNPGLTSLEGAPKTNIPQFEFFLKKGFVFTDNILTKKISIKIHLGITIYKTKKLGYKKNAPIVYIASNGKLNAHGNSAKNAIDELAFKSNKRDISEYKNLPLDTLKTPQEWAFIYRIITGACQTGIKMFMDSQGKLKKKYSLQEIIEYTAGQYGIQQFKNHVIGATHE